MNSSDNVLEIRGWKKYRIRIINTGIQGTTDSTCIVKATGRGEDWFGLPQLHSGLQAHKPIQDGGRCAGQGVCRAAATV